MDIRLEILKQFKDLYWGKNHQLFSDTPGYEAWVVKLQSSGEYGVAFKCSDDFIFNDRFASVELKTLNLKLNNEVKKVFAMTTSNKLLEKEFAGVCSEFVDPKNRNQILADPKEWWATWKDMFGNESINYPEYSVIGELMFYEHCLLNPDKYQGVKWTGVERHNHDIVTFDKDYEVKSTVVKGGAEIHISSEFQLCDNGKELYLVFFRFIRNGDVSIDDMVNRLVNRCHCERSILEQNLTACGYINGSVARGNKYYCEECRLYKVKEGEFPIITDNSFVGGKKPTGVKHIDYEVTLEHLPYEIISLQ